jgi:PAS domain S-box-containing protein
MAIRAAMDPLFPATPPFITLYPAVMLAGLLCGPLPSAVAGLLGLLAADFLWIPPRFSVAMTDKSDRLVVVLFVLASSVILWAVAALRARLEAASVAKDALDLGLAAGGIGTWEFNLRTQQITASPTAYALHGLPENTTRTMPEDWLRGVPPDDAAAARTALQAAVNCGTLAVYSYRVFGAAGPPRWIAARGKVVSTGGERRLLCALVDITDQIAVQEELRRERERLRLALSAGSLAVWDYYTATGEATTDLRYARTMGFEPGVESLTRAQIGERIHPEDRPRVAAEHDAIVASGAEYRIEFRIITASGEIRWMLSQGIAIKDDAPFGPGRIVGIIQDITDRKRREQDLRDLAATRELLIREADHRIKNSLQMVTSLLSAQLRGIEDPQAADALRGAITRVGSIAASHLALQASADLKAVDFAVTLQDLCAHFVQLHPAITVVCRPRSALLLEADRAIPLGLAVSEVLTNAMRHAFAGRDAGRVVVEAWTDQGVLVVSISDDGVGLSPHHSESGLGSRIIRSLAAQIGAALQMETAPQGGTAVTLRLDLLPDETARRATA